MYSVNRLFFLTLGSVCFLVIPFFWLALYFDFSALENFVIALSASEFVGYPIPELLGAERGTSVVAQVQRIEILFTIFVIAYSFFFVGLSFMKEADKRMRYFTGGIATPLFFGLLVFWLKFIEDDHIISKTEKYELFEYTIGCLVLSVLLFTYSFRSKKRPRPSLQPVEAQVEEDFEGGAASAESEGQASSEEEDVLPRPDSEDQPPSETEDTQTTPKTVEELPSPEPLEEPGAIEPPPEPEPEVAAQSPEAVQELPSPEPLEEAAAIEPPPEPEVAAQSPEVLQEVPSPEPLEEAAAIEPPPEPEVAAQSPEVVQEVPSPESLEEPAIEPLPEPDDLASPDTELPLAELEIGYPSPDEVPPPSPDSAENLKPDRS